jgi:hypothetical protein
MIEEKEQESMKDFIIEVIKMFFFGTDYYCAS